MVACKFVCRFVCKNVNAASKNNHTQTVFLFDDNDVLGQQFDDKILNDRMLFI